MLAIAAEYGCNGDRLPLPHIGIPKDCSIPGSKHFQLFQAVMIMGFVVSYG